MPLLSPEERKQHQKRHALCMMLLKIFGSLSFVTSLFSAYFAEDYLLSRVFGYTALGAFAVVCLVAFSIQGFKINRVIPLETYQFPYEAKKDFSNALCVYGSLVWASLGLLVLGIGSSHTGPLDLLLIASPWILLFGGIFAMVSSASSRNRMTLNEVGLCVQAHREAHVIRYEQMIALDVEVERISTGKSTVFLYVLILYFTPIGSVSSLPSVSLASVASQGTNAAQGAVSPPAVSRYHDDFADFVAQRYKKPLSKITFLPKILNTQTQSPQRQNFLVPEASDSPLITHLNLYSEQSLVMLFHILSKHAPQAMLNDIALKLAHGEYQVPR